MNAGRKMKIGAIEAIVILLVLGFLTGYIKMPTLAAGAGVDQQVTGSCANAGINPTVYTTAFWVDPTQNNKQTQIATTVTLAKQGTSQIYNQSTSSATAALATAVPCGDKVADIAGDGGGTTYYYNGAAFDALGVSHSNTIEVKKSGAATIAVHNDTATGWASTILLGNDSITDPDSSIAVRVMPPSGAGQYFGDLGWAMCVKYPALNFTNVYPQPNNGLASIAHVSGTTTRDTVRCYDMPGILVAGGSPYYGTLYLDKVSSRFGNATIGVDVTLVDKTSGLFNGMLYTGFDSSASGGDGQATDLGRADVTQANLMNISATPA